MDPQSEDWLVCGGGPQLANWHLSALRPTTTFEYADASFAQHVLFHDDLLISAGSDHVLVAGPPHKEEEVEAEGEEVEEEEEEKKEHILVCGNSNRIDVCSKLGYVILSLEV